MNNWENNALVKKLNTMTLKEIYVFCEMYNAEIVIEDGIIKTVENKTN